MGFDATQDQIGAYLSVTEGGYYATETEAQVYLEIVGHDWILRNHMKSFMGMVEFVNRHHLWHQMQEPSFELMMFVKCIVYRRVWATKGVWNSGGVEHYLAGFAKARCARGGETAPAPPTPIEPLRDEHLHESQKVFDKLAVGKQGVGRDVGWYYTISNCIFSKLVMDAMDEIGPEDPDRVAKFTATTGIVNTHGKKGAQAITALLRIYHQGVE